MSRPLGARARSGIKWGGLGVVLSLVFQLGFGAAMARLLDPAAFGLIAMCMVGLRLFSYISQIGLSVSLSLVQRPRVEAADIRFALGVVWLAGLCAMAVVMLAAPLAARFFHNDAVAPLLRLLAVGLLLQGLASVPMALLRRALRFREQAFVELGSYALGYGAVGVLAAWQGWGVWALVAATLGQNVVALIAGYVFTRHPLRPSLQGERAVLWGYGARHTLISLLEFLAANLDAALIGRLLGESALGLYNRALMLTNQPVDRAAGVLTRVLFPLLAALQGDRAKVGSVFMLGLGLIGVFGGVVSLSLCASASHVVAVLLGPRWIAAVPIVQLLALAIPVMFMCNIAGVLCDALALLRLKLRVQLFGLVVVASLMLLLYPRGVQGIALALILGESLRLLVYLVVLAPQLAYRPGQVLRVLACVVLTSALAYALVAGIAAGSTRAAWPPLVALLADMAAGGLALLLACLALVATLAATESGQMAQQHVPGWAWAQRLLGRLGVLRLLGQRRVDGHAGPR